MRAAEGQAAEVRGAVCLVLAYFEEGEALRTSLASVRLEEGDSVVVVDDGSRRLPARDFCPETAGGAPVRLVELPRNRGVAVAARTGVAAAPPEAAYIARLDCRDVCSAERFTLQRAHLDAHPECGIVGSAVRFRDPAGRHLYTLVQPTEDAAIRRRMRVNCAFTQPAVMFRRSAYEAAGGYSEDYPWAEDYALFRALLRVSAGHNLASSLVACTTMDGGISQRHRRRQLLTRMRIIREHWDWHPGSAYGLLRAAAQLLTSRNLTSRVRRADDRLRGGSARAQIGGLEGAEPGAVRNVGSTGASGAVHGAEGRRGG
ncbi:glycosyltransferase [Brevibacterium album]|uniref:glycosyltransferase n=1 Tax=Brevibacterium album TaxID=417948 RepID=UPI001B7FECC7|nr:glycosyltransferase [Brevibacterium album]